MTLLQAPVLDDPEMWTRVRRGSLLFEAESVKPAGTYRWRSRYTRTWRRLIPTPWRRGPWGTFYEAYTAFVAARYLAGRAAISQGEEP